MQTNHTKIETPRPDTVIPPARRLGSVEEYYFSRKLREIAGMRAAGADVLNLGIGSPDLPPHPSVIDTLQRASADPANHAYQSYQGLPELRQAFADWYQRYFQVGLRPESEILPLIGSKEGIMHLSMAFLNAGDEVLVPNPGYPTYRSAAELAGAKVRTYPLSATNEWLPDLEWLTHQRLEGVKMMWVNYPHMPTGSQAATDFWAELVDFARRHRILLVNDNPYAFILNEQPTSILSAPGALEVALELNSLSKAHNMAGWRMGMLAGSAAHLQTVLRFKSNMDSGMFKPIQLAAITALELPETWYQQLNDIYATRRQAAYRLLDHLGCTYGTDQVGLFVWARVPNDYYNAYQLSDHILENTHVFLTPGGIFGDQGDPYIRISLCSKEPQFEEAIRRITSHF